MSHVDFQEIEKFNALAHHWWDPNGELKTLHQLNPLRLNWIHSHVSLADQRVLDVGCGGGILAEAMAACGAHVKGIDLSTKALAAAELHGIESGLAVDYEAISAKDLALREPHRYDVVTCMEMLEHVPEPAAIVAACAALVKPGGWVFFSTLNRNLKAYLLAVIGAEYMTGMLPRGTHDYARFICPAELAAFARAAELRVHTFKGMHYHPLGDYFALSNDTSVNYLLACVREDKD